MEEMSASLWKGSDEFSSLDLHYILTHLQLCLCLIAELGSDSFIELKVLETIRKLSHMNLTLLHI